MKLRKKCCVRMAVTLTFSDASCKNSRIRGRIRPVHNGTGAVGKSTAIAVETNRCDCYRRIQTETLPSDAKTCPVHFQAPFSLAIYPTQAHFRMEM